MVNKISVVIPCYNMGHYIGETLDSVLNYSTKYDIEVLIINDGSDDGTTEALLKKLDNPIIRVIHQENKGLSNARNTGINLAQSEFIILLDADNKISEGYFNKGLSILKNNENIGLVFGNVQYFGDDDHYHKPGEFSIVRLLRKNYIDACILLRKSAFNSVGGYDENMLIGFEDWDLNIRIFFKGWKIYYVDELCFHYRIKKVSMLTKANEKRQEIINYMFSKPKLRDAMELRKIILNSDSTTAELKSITQRKMMKLAMRVERMLKSFKS
ncbi:glycosyltransferase family A protein [Winogradskyella maritima]|uniref:Glycosyltransferase family 2 protein n=1 Tax=Winogradskyella maritima TaxID=1517766 RepID=A0ABV8AJV7_9FLAO|nr:glycosyltransferase family A protein [Winogradskyella maritima]